LQPLGEQRRLRALAGAVESLERHEHARTTIRSVRAVVTGGAGFSGSNLVDSLLARGDDVTVVDNLSSGKREFVDASATFREQDVRDELSFDGAEVLCRLAAQADLQTSMKRPECDADVNVVGTVRVLEAARAAG